MENIIRDMRDIETGDRHALEHVVGAPLRDDQRLIIQIVSLDVAESQGSPRVGADVGAGELPQWCHVYEGLTDDEIVEVEQIALARADLTRPAE